MIEPKPQHLRDALILLMLIADSEKAFSEGRWISQDEMESEIANLPLIRSTH